MGSLGIPIDMRVNISKRREKREVQISERFKQLCSSEIRRYFRFFFVNVNRYKALSATGYKSESDAAQWLLFHLDDPTLDEPSYREFCLFLCAHSELAMKMQDFWNESSINDGWNQAHEFPPHITLLSNVRVSDDKVLQFHRIYDRILQGNSDLLKFDQIPLKLVRSDDFIGYIVSSDKVNANLEKIYHLFLDELLKGNGLL